MQIQDIQTQAPCDTLLTFVIGPYRLCGPMTPVRRIITPPQLTHLPLSKPTAAGVFRFEGRIALAFDLHHAFGLTSQHKNGGGLLIVTNIVPGMVAFWVDEVLDVLPATDFSWRTTPAALGGIAERFARNGEQLFLYLTYERLFDAQTRALIAAARLSTPVIPTDLPPATVITGDAETDIVAASVMPTGIEPAGQTHTETFPAAMRQPTRAVAFAPMRQVLTRKTAHVAPRPRAMTERQRRADQVSVVQPLARETIAQTTVTRALPTYDEMTTNAAIETTAQSSATETGGYPRSLAAAILLLPVLAGVVYSFWPTHKSEPATEQRQTVAVTEPLSSAPVPTPSPSGRMPAPEAEPAQADRKLEVTAGEFVISVESSAGQQVPVPALSAEPASNEREQIVHTVRRGDTLWAISRYYLGNPFLYPELARVSMIANPNLIRPGDIVRIRRTAARTANETQSSPRS